MRKVCLILFGLCLCLGDAFAAGRDANTVSRGTQSTVSRTTTTQRRTVVSRDEPANIKKLNQRNVTNKTVVGRTATNRQQSRNATRTPAKTSRISRAATTTVKTRTFGTNYNSCRDAYFSCMDQFCANVNENYRRCICSSKLKGIQDQEKALSQTADTLTDFANYNIDSVSKTAAEVKAMGSASAGEKAIKKDKSSSANTLNSISAVLQNSKKQSLSTAGTLDIAGDIRQIWTTTELINGADIANLTGESLFNAVHAQCNELAKEFCATTDLKMVSSAYGIYVDNDCAILQNNIDNKRAMANAEIRSTRQKLQGARLENYNAHNSLNVNDCIAAVRQTITSDVACGAGYIHCLDFSGKYINFETGEAIYSPEFYKIENQLSLSGDVLKNGQNAEFINALNRKKTLADKDLDFCRDDADYVWNEFMRQALVEIYQGQQKRVETVKNECLQIVNACYLKQSDNLKNFTDEKSQMIFVQSLELSEEMCADKLNTCSNLYGGGPDGLDTLIATMTGITDLTIEESCPELLADFAKSVCAVPVNDSAHSYPYNCRKYAPGDNHFARIAMCNENFVNPFSRSDIVTTKTITETFTEYLGMCRDMRKKYTSCRPGYYLYSAATDTFSLNAATECRSCPTNLICPGQTSEPVDINDTLYQNCGQYYIGSLYQQLVVYALQNCTRTTNTASVLSESLLAQVDSVAKSIKSALVPMLSKECTDMGGVWIDSQWIDENNDGYHDTNGNVLFGNFYVVTGANKLWGYCKGTTN